MINIRAFIEARVAGDERAARQTDEDGGPDLEYEHRYGRLTISTARVLRDVEAKRRILVLAEQLDQSADVDAGPAAMELWRLLAMPYAGHPEFRAEWAA